MNSKWSMFYVIGSITLLSVVLFGWQLFAGDGYESAEYTVVKADGKFEIREYPELTLVKTKMKAYGNGSDGSFMRLFRYISGDNESKQKVAMTTPVFMEAAGESEDGKMSFVVPKEVAADSVPIPSNQAVEIAKRPSGKYAVIRFNGRMNQRSIDDAETKLREWIADNDLTPSSDYEFAGYDPPWTPGLFRRNEILIPLK